jgi:peptidoglycan hydrolase CwlO-like protein
MKKTLLAGLATGLFFLISAGIAIAGDEAKNKTDNNNSKTTGLYDNVTILQEQINSLTERL